MKSFEEVGKFLESQIPRSEIYKRPGSGGRDLSYFEYWWTNHLLNQCFGNMGWSSETHEVAQLPGDEPTFRAKVTIKAMVRGLDAGTYMTVVHDGIGTCKGKDTEMAVKGAESDAFKRAAVKFGIRLGLGLYDKSEEFIHDDKKQSAAPAQEPTRSEPQRPQAQKGAPVAQQVRVNPNPKTSTPEQAPSREALNSLIRSTASVAFSKKVKYEAQEGLFAEFDLPAMKAKIASYGAGVTEDLTDEQAKEVLAYLQGLIA